MCIRDRSKDDVYGVTPARCWKVKRMCQRKRCLLYTSRSNKSYGINVAKLAKLPDAILNRANTLLKSLEAVSYTHLTKTKMLLKQLKSIKK